MNNLLKQTNRFFLIAILVLMCSSFTTENIQLHKGVNTIHFDSLVSSIRFSSSDLILIDDGDSVRFYGEGHSNFSALYVFKKPLDSCVVLVQNELNIKYQTFYIAPLEKTTFRISDIENDSCARIEPYSVSQSEWREGLESPKSGRVLTPTEHLIIHHAAGSNTATNYTDIVRNYYVLHTEGNGWDDIGYNYLIAQNGLIYKGRDPQGKADQDNVQGAHYCAHNQNTMGICLLGNYMTIDPTDQTIDALTDLLAWKCVKEGFDVDHSQVHASTGVNTPRITGHRHACNTSCPGDHVWDLLPQIRTTVKQKMVKCETIEKEESSLEYKLILNPYKGRIFIESASELDDIEVYDLNGLPREIQVEKLNDYVYEISMQWTGIGVVVIRKGDESASELVFIEK